MPGYVVLSVEVLDAERYQEYARLGPPTVAQYGGRYLVRGGEVDRRDGNWEPKRLVIIGEGTHGVLMEKNRMQLFREVQLFLDERGPSF